MKSFKQLISEVAEPNNEDELNFKAKHQIEVIDHPAAEDTQFTGGTKKAPTRKADYEPGQDENVYEEIKGWKNAHSDLGNARRREAQQKMTVKLVSLKKDGNESKMHDATTRFKSVEAAHDHHENLTKLNPNRKIRHALYVDEKKHSVLGESVDDHLDEAFVAGTVKLKDNTTLKIRTEQASVLNDLYKQLKGDRQDEMFAHTMSSKNNFESMVKFATETVGN